MEGRPCVPRRGSPEAEVWVGDRALRILSGDVGQVVKGIRQSTTKRGLSGARRDTLADIANYLYRNRDRMRYHDYLAKGWPIASGSVEGACKNLVKDRMERSGMRWTETWPKPSSSFAPSTSAGTSTNIGPSTSPRANYSFIPPSGPSFQSSHTQINRMGVHPRPRPGSRFPPSAAKPVFCPVSRLLRAFTHFLNFPSFLQPASPQ